MDNDEALWWAAQLDAATYLPTDDGEPFPEESKNMRAVVRNLVDARQREVDLAAADIERRDAAIARAEAALEGARQAQTDSLANHAARSADLQRCTEIRDAYLASLPAEPTNLSMAAHSPTIVTTPYVKEA